MIISSTLSGIALKTAMDVGPKLLEHLILEKLFNIHNNNSSIIHQPNNSLQRELAVARETFEIKKQMLAITAQQQENQLDRHLQLTLEESRQKFSALQNDLQRQLMRELEQYKAEIQKALQKEAQQFQIWKLGQEQQFVIQLKEIDAKISRQNAILSRQDAKRDKNSPFFSVAEDIISYISVQPEIPLTVFISPPVMLGDRYESNINEFPPIERYLAQTLRNFFGKYNTNSRPIQLRAGDWVTNRFYGEYAIGAIFNELKSIPVMILESEIERHDFHLNLAFWDGGFLKFRYGNALRCNWKELLYTQAKNHAKMLFELQQKQNKTDDEWKRQVGAKKFELYQHNLMIAQQEVENLNLEIPLDLIDRSYNLTDAEYDKLRSYLGIYHCIFAGLIADEYFLIHVPPSQRRVPLLIKLLPELLQGLPKTEVDELNSLVINSCEVLYQVLENLEPVLVPELRLDWALELVDLPGYRTKAEELLNNSMIQWLQLRGVTNSRDLIGDVKRLLIKEDLSYITKFNQLLVKLGQKESLDIGLAYLQRGREFLNLKQYQSAIDCYDEALTIKPNLAQAYKERGDAYYGLGQLQEALDSYVLAANYGHSSALQLKTKLEEEIEAKRKAEEEAKRQAEEARRRAEEEAKRKAEEARRRAEEEAKRKAEEPIQIKKIISSLVQIPGGDFVKHWGYYDELIKINTFLMLKHPITNIQWYAIMGTKPSERSGDKFSGPNQPVLNVTWNDAQEYCQRLSEKTNWKFRLPTEAEWEYAARGGTTTKYHFGNDNNQLDQYAWYDKNSGYQTHEVMLKKPNQYGLYDMMGNVWEWCEDEYRNNISNRVVRGGSWGDSSGRCVVSAWGYSCVSGGWRNDGFRVVLGA